jgi:hypothetical protein
MTGHSSDTIPTAQRAPGRQRHGAAPERSIQRKNLEQRLTRSPSLIEGRLSGHEGESCSFRLSVLSPCRIWTVGDEPNPTGDASNWLADKRTEINRDEWIDPDAGKVIFGTFAAI